MPNFQNFDDPHSDNLVGTWEGSTGGAYETSQGWFYREEYLLHNLLSNGIYILESDYTRDYCWDPINHLHFCNQIVRADSSSQRDLCLTTSVTCAASSEHVLNVTEIGSDKAAYQEGI